MKLTKPFRAGAATAVAVLAAMLCAAPASAQSIFFDWGSNETVNDSGREVVNFEDKARPGELIVSFGDRRVYFLVGPGKALSYPIAVPREKSKWAGSTSVSQKRVNPSWTPTPEMMIENPRLPPWVPGGHPMNPLGTHALYLGSSLYRIHGTDAPWTIGTAASKGCVRMYNKDVQDLYPRVPVGTKVTVTYQTYKTSPLDSESSKGLLATLDKGKKIKGDDDVAAAADQATKKFRGDDSDSDARVQKAAATASEAVGKDIAPDSASDGEKQAAVKSESDKATPDKDHTGKDSAGKSSVAAVEGSSETDAAAPSKKRPSEKHAVETGSVDKSSDKASDKAISSAKSDEKDKAPTKERLTSKDASGTVSHKQAAGEDASAIANRALAAAERAAAAAERAADAAERASAAAIKASSKEPAKSAEAAAPMEWPVVKSGTP